MLKSKSLFFGETCKLGATARNEKCYIIKKKWISKSKKHFQSSWKMNSVSFIRRRFPLTVQTIFHSPKWKNVLLPKFQNSTLCLHVSKPKWEGDLLLILRVINFSCFSSRWFRGARQDAGEHSRSPTNTIFDELNKFTQGCIITKIPSVQYRN